MGTALSMAIIFIYIVLASQFGSFLQPLAIMVSLPLSLIGVLLGLMVAGSTINMFSLIGFIMLMGLVTKNGILLVDFANRERRRGLTLNEALANAGVIRFRPIIMTTLAMIFGMIPLGLAVGGGGAQRAPMAHAVVGGLISSTLLTLIVVPVILSYIDSITRRFARLLPKAPDEVAERGVKSNSVNSLSLSPALRSGLPAVLSLLFALGLEINQQRFQLNVANAPCRLIGAHPFREAFATFLETRIRLRHLYLEHIDHAGHDIAIVEHLQIGIATDGVLSHPAPHARLLPCLDGRRLMRLLAFHWPAARNDPASAGPGGNEEDFDSPAIGITEAERGILLPESAGEELFRNSSQLLKQCEWTGRAGLPAFLGGFHIR